MQSFDDGKFKSCSLRAEIFQQRRAGKIETSRFPTDGLFQVFDGEVLEDQRRLAHRPLASRRQLAQESVLMLLMMLDEFDGTRKRLSARDADGAVGASFDDVMMDATDVDDGKREVAQMIRFLAQ